jgi:hypothetical protein
MRPLFILETLPPKELSDRELAALVQKVDPWEVNRELTDQELEEAAQARP